MKAVFAVLAAITLVACQPAVQPDRPNYDIKTFAPIKMPRDVLRSNADIAAEFMDFHFRDEKGGTNTRFTRFSEPITVAFNAPAPPIIMRELTMLVERLRQEAGVTIAIAPAGSPANIYIERLPFSRIQTLSANTQCFVVPNARNAKEFRKGWRSGRSQWANVKQRTTAAVFIPSDQSTQIERDCLHEEIAQALGPLNDLYRVPSSIFNDDDMHKVLTPYDMLILRMTYAPELRNGMSAAQVSAQLPAILARLNPRGNGYGSAGVGISYDWNTAIKEGQRLSNPTPRRVSGARRATRMALAQNLGANRLGFSILTHARAAMDTEPDARIKEFSQALNIYTQAYGAQSIQAGVTSMELAFLWFRLGAIDKAETLVPNVKAVGQRLQDAHMLFGALQLEAAIAAIRNDPTQAFAKLEQSRGWGIYAFGADGAVTQVENEIRLLLSK